jgi:hypothetical protein
MITNEERESVINAAVERILLRLPEVMGNLMANHANNIKMNREFYAKYPDFKDHKDVVTSVIEYFDGKNPSAEYSEVLEKAVPEIRKQIKTQSGLTFDTTEKPNLDFSKSLTSDFGNGEL